MNQSFATLGSSDGKNKSDVKVFLFWTKMAVLHQTTSSYYMHKSSIRSVWSNWIVFHLPLQNPVKTYTKTHWPPPKTLKTLKHLHVFNKIPTFFTWKVSIPPISQPKKWGNFSLRKTFASSAQTDPINPLLRLGALAFITVKISSAWNGLEVSVVVRISFNKAGWW